nr:unnamed protein product [Callosobruchus analis]
MNSSNILIETVIDNRASMESYNTQSVKASPKKVSLFVSRLHPGTKSDDLVTFFKKTFPEAVCEKITPQHPDPYASFKLDQVLEDNFDSSTNFILCGDFSVDPIRDENNYKILINILESYGLKNTVHNKTHKVPYNNWSKIMHSGGLILALMSQEMLNITINDPLCLKRTCCYFKLKLQ